MGEFSTFNGRVKEYENFIYRLAHLKKGRKDPNSLVRLSSIQKKLGYPDQNYRSIHVAGTNGKGSVCCKIAKSLEKLGFSVGLFISPHVFCVRERISVDGKWITEEEMGFFAEKTVPLVEEERLELSFFEELTLLAMLFFSEKKVDYVVWETGMGGRLDATNLIYPVVSVITSIGWDHMTFLGNTLEQIAQAKAGIIKKNIPVVIGPSVVQKSIFEKAEHEQAEIFQVLEKTDHYDQENQLIAKQALQTLFPNEKDIFCEKALSQNLPSRFERISIQNKEIILDGAHNISGFTKLQQALQSCFPGKRVGFIFAFSQEKIFREGVEVFFPIWKKAYFTTWDHSRLASIEHMQAQMEGFKKPIEWIVPVSKALQKALQENSLVVVTGSFFLMKVIKEELASISPY